MLMTMLSISFGSSDRLRIIIHLAYGEIEHLNCDYSMDISLQPEECDSKFYYFANSEIYCEISLYGN